MTNTDVHPAQIRAARAILNMTQGDLADLAGITRKTLARLENGASLSRDSTTDVVVEVLRSRGVIFLLERNTHGVAVPRPST